MFSRKKEPPIKSLIAQGAHLRGDLSFTHGLRIDGEVIGDVRASAEPSVLVVSESGRIQGAVHAAHVIVSGVVDGPVHASELLEAQPKARITGDVRYKALEMHQGAIISGQMQPESALLLEANPTLKLTSNPA